jgi:hypothetical protein
MPVCIEPQSRKRFQALGARYGIALQILVEMWGFQQNRQRAAIDLMLHQARGFLI